MGCRRRSCDRFWRRTRCQENNVRRDPAPTRVDRVAQRRRLPVESEQPVGMAVMRIGFQRRIVLARHKIHHHRDQRGPAPADVLVQLGQHRRAMRTVSGREHHHRRLLEAGLQRGPGAGVESLDLARRSARRQLHSRRQQGECGQPSAPSVSQQRQRCCVNPRSAVSVTCFQPVLPVLCATARRSAHRA